jgi:hypothetical protein
MIETREDCRRFIEESNGDWIIHIVPVEEGIHPVINSPSILFIKVLSTEKIYWFAFDHPDSIPTVSHSYFIQECLLNKKNIKWTLDKKIFGQLIDLPDVYDINLCGFLENNEIFELYEFDTSAHDLIRRTSFNLKKINRVIPLMKHLEAFQYFCESAQKIIKEFNIDSGYLGMNSVIIPTLSDIEKNGIYVDRELFKKRFQIDADHNSMVYSQYHVYTSTGRPSNRFCGVNYSALNTKDGSRNCFISRYGNNGKIIIIDYAAFHPRIICHLTKYPLSTDIDIYSYLAKLYFQKKIVDEIDIAESKKITFKQLYGRIEDKYAHIKYLSNLKTFIKNQWEFFNKNGYIQTPIFKRHITNKHIIDPNPEKVFNYILQAAEGEIAIPKIQEVQKYLRDKKTKAILYLYDSVIYDFHKDDGLDTLNDIRNIMSWNGKFPMKIYIGDSYQTVKQIFF